MGDYAAFIVRPKKKEYYDKLIEDLYCEDNIMICYNDRIKRFAMGIIKAYSPGMCETAMREYEDVADISVMHEPETGTEDYLTGMEPDEALSSQGCRHVWTWHGRSVLDDDDPPGDLMCECGEVKFKERG